MSDSATRSDLNRFAAVFAGGTLVSRVLGLARDMSFALIPTSALSAFLVAFRLPNMLRDLIGEGAMNAAFVPVYAHTLEKENEDSFRELVGSAMSAMLMILAGVTVAGVVVVPWLLSGLNALQGVTGSDPVPGDQVGLMARLGRWTFPYIFFIGMAVFCMGPLYAVRHYATPAWSPALLNVALIAAALLARDLFVHVSYALVAGVWLGGIAQLLALYLALARKTGVWGPNLRPWHPGVKRILWLMLPVVAGQAAGEVNKLVDTLFAAQIGGGAVAWLYFANRLVQLPLSIFGMAMAAAILPSLSAASARQDTGDLRATMMYGLRQSYFLVLPAALGLIALGPPIVRLLFQRGAFDEADAARTVDALAILALGLPGFAGVKVAVQGFYAAQDTKTPVIAASMSMLLNIVLNIVLVRPLGYLGLATASAIAFTVNFAVLYALLSQRYGKLWDGPFLHAVTRITLTGALMAAAAFGLFVWTASRFAEDTWGGRLICVILPMAGAVGVYAGMARLLGVEELGNLLRALKRRR